jgi:hypothetical protein
MVLFLPLLGLMAIVVGLPTSIAFGDDGAKTFSARFRGIDETPSISTDATASLKVKINGSGNTATIDYSFTFSGLRATVTQAHIHFAESKVAGGVMVFLCSSLAGAPAGTPSCGTGTSGTISRTLTAADVNPIAAQGIGAGEMGRVVQAIRDGAAYGNVHSMQFPAGEARGQLVPSDKD